MRCQTFYEPFRQGKQSGVLEHIFQVSSIHHLIDEYFSNSASDLLVQLLMIAFKVDDYFGSNDARNSTNIILFLVYKSEVTLLEFALFIVNYKLKPLV